MRMMSGILHPYETRSSLNRLLKMGDVVLSFWEGWKRVGKKIGDFQARVLLSFFYYVFFAPFAIAVRWLSDPLAIKDGAPRGWQLKREGETSPTERATRQF